MVHFYCWNLWVHVGTNPTARRRAFPIRFVKSFNWCDWVSMLRDASALGVLVLVRRHS